MNSQIQAFDLSLAVPLPCPRKMQTQDITPWTAGRIAAALLRPLLPALRVTPPLNRRA